jgi:hypothetical protein
VFEARLPRLWSGVQVWLALQLLQFSDKASQQKLCWEFQVSWTIIAYVVFKPVDLKLFEMQYL